MSEKRKKRTPLKEKPLRNPGESIQEEIERVLYDHFFPVAVIFGMFAYIAGMEWWRKYSGATPQPVLWTLLAGALGVYTFHRYRKTRKQIRYLQQGFKGEKLVAQKLEALRGKGFQVFHDIPVEAGGRKFNIDHLLVGPQGVFVIETKTWSKPWKGETKITYDNEKLLVNGRERSCNPIIQVKALRRWVYDFLREQTGGQYKVKGVVLMPGWFVEQPADKASIDVWVLNPKALESFLNNESTVLKENDIHKIVRELKKHITG